ncbi:MAG: PIN/TRAM domain-containing protein, partial [Acidimicrobiia bacterium]
MILVELVRLVIVVSFTAAGYQVGHRVELPLSTIEADILVSALVGAGLGYVVGGIVGRALISGVGAVEARVEAIPGATLLSGGIGLVVGIALSAIVSWPIIVWVPPWFVAYPAAALVVLVVSYLSIRIALRKRTDLLAMMGLSQVRSFGAPIERHSGGVKVLDTSAVIDGRIADVARSGFLSGRLICPKFVLFELQSIADSSDPVRRARGRRGLEILDVLQREPHVQLDITEEMIPEIQDVDAKLIALCKRADAALVTTDFGLHRTAELQGIPVLNMNNLAAVLKPVVIPGEEISVE